MTAELLYLSGFGNHFESEALAGSLPKGQNNPQAPSRGLYAEQISGSAFTAPSHENLRSWLYRILPSVCHGPFEAFKLDGLLASPLAPSSPKTPPDQMRWGAPAPVKGSADFLDSLTTYCVNGDVNAQAGVAIHLYNANKSMERRSFVNADGDFLIVPQEGGLLVQTEMGLLSLDPTEIAVIPRGIKFSIALKNTSARGYICENYGAHFQLPYKGPIGANGLANPRDFLYPAASFTQKKEKHQLVRKFMGGIFQCEMDHSPYDVVAWHGNYAPFKYDLKRFNTINTVSFDHPDPSIFTVLTSPGLRLGTANVDFVIFPPRWSVAENTFRPPYFHVNIMSEFMGLIHGVYDAKPSGDGFVPGGASLHNCMSPHGPETEAFEKASQAALKPEKISDTLAFMFETSLPLQATAAALNATTLQKDYLNCWQGLKPKFKQ